MGEPMKKTSCQIACWAMGAAAGFVAFVMLIALGDWGVIQAVFGAAVIFILLGGLLSWILCKPLPALGEVQAGMAEIDATDTPASAHGATPAASAPEAAPAAITPAAPASAVPSAASVTATDPLTDDAAPSAVPPVSAAPMAPVNAVSTDGVAPVATDADRPATLSAARGGQPDNLKEIKGIGPKLEVMLHGMGFFHFDQIASWTATELAWVDQNLTGFKGRASRDNWVDQAKILASGGETAFSKRVEDGDVY